MILDDWFQTAQGKNVAEAFVLQLSAYRERFVGKNMLQLGQCGKNEWLQLFNFKNMWISSPCMPESLSSLVADPLHLPFARHSVDCIIAPLTIELSYSSDHLINEIDRVLNPMGYVVFLGVNPLSLWGLTLKFSQLSCFKKNSINLTSFFKLQHAMKARGYQQCLLKHFYFIPPLVNHKWLNRLNFLNQMGKIISPMPAGFYCMVVQKYQPDFLFAQWDTLDDFIVVPI